MNNLIKIKLTNGKKTLRNPFQNEKSKDESFENPKLLQNY